MECTMNCKKCDKIFFPVNSWQKFCSIICRNRYHGNLRTEKRRKEHIKNMPEHENKP